MLNCGYEMNKKLLSDLQDQDITLAIVGNKIIVSASPDVLTDEVRNLIKNNKQGLMRALSFKVIDYALEKLHGELPIHYRQLDNCKIRAFYYVSSEFDEHVDRVREARFWNAKSLIEACEVYGGAMIGAGPRLWVDPNLVQQAIQFVKE